MWQVKSGTIFDSIIITTDAAEAEAGVAAFKVLAEGESAMKKEAEDAAKAEEDRCPPGWQDWEAEELCKRLFLQLATILTKVAIYEVAGLVGCSLLISRDSVYQ